MEERFLQRIDKLLWPFMTDKHARFFHSRQIRDWIVTKKVNCEHKNCNNVMLKDRNDNRLFKSLISKENNEYYTQCIVEYCNHCNKKHCNECARIHTCNQCDRNICKEYEYCDSCCEYYCNECYMCIAKCYYCNKWRCMNCASFHEIDGHPSCDKCYYEYSDIMTNIHQ